MGIMAGNTGQFSPFTSIRRIDLTGQWMPAAITKCYGVNPAAYLFMAGKTEFIYRLPELTWILRCMVVMAKITHFSHKRAMNKFESAEFLLLILMTVITELRPFLGNRILRAPLQRVALDAGVSTDWCMHELLVGHSFVTFITGIIPVRHVSYLLSCRSHVVTRYTERLSALTMQQGRSILLGNITPLRLISIINISFQNIELFVAGECFDEKLVFTLVP